MSKFLNVLIILSLGILAALFIKISHVIKIDLDQNIIQQKPTVNLTNDGSIKNLKDLYNYLPAVDIDTNGIFKYIQIRGTWRSDPLDDKAIQEPEDVIFIRGYQDFDYHAEIFDNFYEEFEMMNQEKQLMVVDKGKLEDMIIFDCPGGGRIIHDGIKKKILIYGYSITFGRADHTITKKMLEEKYTNYASKDIEWSNQGY